MPRFSNCCYVGAPDHSDKYLQNKINAFVVFMLHNKKKKDKI